MKKLIKGFTYTYYRNIGWQDKTIRTIIGIVAAVGAIYFYNKNFTYSVICGVLFLAQFITVALSKCIICYFMGQCTISYKEKQKLESKGIKYEHN